MRAAGTWFLAAAAALLAPSIAAAQDAAPVAEAAATAAPAPDATLLQPVDPAADQAATGVYDPWEPLNRDLFAVHEGIDRAVLGPVARGYRCVTPQFFRTGVSNFLFNLRAPVIFANDVLQADPERAATTAARFGVNTTIGILGLFDVAERMGLERHDEDFGQTLAVWGVDSGPYVFIPVLGPSNVRDTAGKVVDFFIDPLTYAEFEGDDTFRTSRTVLTGLSAREALIETIDDIRENSLDPYVSYRTSYGLLRDSSIANGETDDLPDFEDVSMYDQPAADAPQAPDAPQVVSDIPSAPVQTAAR